MKHAGPAALNQLEPLLAEIRQDGRLKERKRGLFYRAGRSFLHFHEDPAGLFADVSTGGESVRLRVSEPVEQRRLLEMIQDLLGA